MIPIKNMSPGIIHLSFRQFLKLAIVVCCALGFVLGLILFAMFLLGFQVHANIVFIRLEGLEAALVNLIWTPMLAVICGSLLAPLAFYPFNFLLRISGGVRLSEKTVPIEPVTAT